MDLKNISEPAFMCEPNGLERDNQIPPKWSSVQYMPKCYGVGKLIWQLNQNYAVHRLGQKWGDVVALFNNVPVGLYRGDVLSVDPAHGGKQLATAMIIAAVPYRSQPLTRNVTDLGEKALRSAWSIVNGRKTSLPLSQRTRRFRVVEVAATGAVTCVLETDCQQDAEDKRKALELAEKQASIETPLD
jgi:hypothetical protein